MNTVASRGVTGAMALVTVVLVVVATQGSLAAAAVCVFALLLLALALLGRERVAVVALAGAFATAPMYRGIGGITNVATPTDLLLLLGLLLLLPELLSRKSRIPAAYVLALGVLVGIGLFASTMNPSPTTSAVFVAQWLLCLGALPAALAMWRPSRSVVDGLLCCYLAGQMVSLLVGLAQGPEAANRYQGLSHHPNDFGLAGGVCVAILLYLFPRYRSARARVALSFLMVASLGSVIISGSRGVTLAVAAILVLLPLVERSGLWTFLGLAVGALGLALLPYLVDIGGPGASLSRLSGSATASYSDSVRETALVDGWHRFLGNPFFGTGLDAVVGDYHNVFLEVAVAVGVFGLAAYLVICYILARPLFGTHPMRRLCYLTWLFVVAGMTLPGIVDRTIAIPMAMAVLAAVPLERAAGRDEPAPPGPRETPAPAAPAVA